MSLQEKAFPVRLLLFDVDGVLTDGKIVVHPDGSESKRFDIRDGMGIVCAQRAGLKTGLLSARSSATTIVRAAQLGISIVYQNVARKLDAYEEILRVERLADREVAYMGDDLFDAPVLARAGLSAAPADAIEEIRQQVDWVSRASGGDGAVRELVELVLRLQGKWAGLLKPYFSENI